MSATISRERHRASYRTVETARSRDRRL